MFDYVLNMPLKLDVKEVYFEEEPMSLKRMKNQQDLVNVLQLTKM